MKLCMISTALITLLVYLPEMLPSPPSRQPPPLALQASCNVNQDTAVSCVQLQSTHVKVVNTKEIQGWFIGHILGEKTNHVCINCYSCQCVHVNTTTCSNSLYVYKLTLAGGIWGGDLHSGVETPPPPHLHSGPRKNWGPRHQMCWSKENSNSNCQAQSNA